MYAVSADFELLGNFKWLKFVEGFDPQEYAVV